MNNTLRMMRCFFRKQSLEFSCLTNGFQQRDSLMSTFAMVGNLDRVTIEKV